MYKKYTLPLGIFVIFENVNTVVFSSESFYQNSYTVLINKSWLYAINLLFKNDVFLSNSTLLEHSAVDNKNNFEFLKKNQIFFKSKILLFYLYEFFTNNSKLFLITTYNNSSLYKINSVDSVYVSAGWLERETGEMFCISYNNKTDSRRLLLDYSKKENPLLKDYPVEGYNDVFYNFFEDQVTFYKSTIVEL